MSRHTFIGRDPAYRAPKSHWHQCTHCPVQYACRLDCDTQSDGEPTCGVCAVERFDRIVPQERIKPR